MRGNEIRFECLKGVQREDKDLEVIMKVQAEVELAFPFPWDRITLIIKYG